MSQSNLAEKIENTPSSLQFSVLDNGVGLLDINVPGDAQNTLKQDFEQDFTAAMAQVTSSPNLKGLVVASSKPGSFMAGADINMFQKLSSAVEITALSQQCQAAFAQSGRAGGRSDGRRD